jgi:hypothetical protein
VVVARCQGFIADNGEAMMIWIGNSVSPRVLLDLFGVDDINLVDPMMVGRPRFSSLFSK